MEKDQESDPCVLHQDCLFCNALSQEEDQQLAIPAHQLCKEKNCKGSKNLVDPPDVRFISDVSCEAVGTGKL